MVRNMTLRPARLARSTMVVGVVVLILCIETLISVAFGGGHAAADGGSVPAAESIPAQTTISVRGGRNNLTPLVVSVGGKGVQGQAYCLHRIEAALGKGGGMLKLPRVVAFPVLGGGFRAEKAWREAFREAGFDTATSPDVATIIISKQWRFDRLPGGALCGATQMFNHIPGAMAIVNKAQLVASLHRLGDGLGPALRAEVDQIMPESYIMADKGECARFVDRYFPEGGNANSGKAGEVQWIAKSARADNAKGIKFPRLPQLRATARAYRDTGKCNFGRIMGLRNPIIQRYLPRPLLVNGRKCDFRVYAYVPSTQPFMAYFHPQFYMKCSGQAYRADSRDIAVAVSNQQVMKKARGVNQNNFIWTPRQFQDYLTNRTLAADDFVDGKMVPQIKRALAVTMRAMAEQPKMVRGRGYFGLFGPDIILDEKLHAWLMEVNDSPGLYYTSTVRTRVTKTVVRDVLHTQRQLLEWEERQVPPLRPRDALTAAALPRLAAFDPIVCEDRNGKLAMFPFDGGLPGRCKL